MANEPTDQDNAGAPQPETEKQDPAIQGQAGVSTDKQKADPILSTPFKLDFANAANIPVVRPLTNDGLVANVNTLGPLANVGFVLSKFILIIISGYILFLIIYLLHMAMSQTGQIDINAVAQMTDSSAFNRHMTAIKAIQENSKAQRDFVTQTSQMVLLNLLLPTLTAILGYIFGSTKTESKTT